MTVSVRLTAVVRTSVCARDLVAVVSDTTPMLPTTQDKDRRNHFNQGKTVFATQDFITQFNKPAAAHDLQFFDSTSQLHTS